MTLMNDSEQLRTEFLRVIQNKFPEVFKKPFTLKSGEIRYSVYQTGATKRWMQVDCHPKHVAVAMDHRVGDISTNDLVATDIPYGLQENRTGIILKKNDDAVNISFFLDYPYDFTQEKFVQFLKQHYESYLKRIRS
ncbi:hypothetical protein FB550_101774 [Neobacillus bataviensis]|uniref:Uncharacterized protein n=1 Tax=Neobacillus bataviensis TaxID=220685 RepID=A0A561DZI1_9BACI|nr:hypothetical protein [Neobacillus bataviensis]TWE08746.1 hypothetical protein FB550_101774 [Neobacillus bataviensis]